MRSVITSGNFKFPEAVSQCMTSARKQRFLTCFFWTFAFSMIANGFSFFSLSPIHDAVTHTVYPNPVWQVQLGRCFIPIYLAIRGEIASPWFSGMLQILFLTVSVYCLTEMIGSDNKLYVPLCAGFLAANLYTLEINALHSYFSDLFCFAQMTVSIGVYLIYKTISKTRILLAFFAFYISFGVYPAFSTYGICLFVLYALITVIADNGFQKDLLKRFAVWILVFLAAVAAYWVTSKLTLAIYHTEAGAQNWSIFSFASKSFSWLLSRVKANYKRFLKVMFYSTGNLGTHFGIASVLFAVLAGISFLVYAVKTKRKKWVYGLAAVCVLAYPFISTLVNTMSGVWTFRTVAAQFLIYPFMLAVVFRISDPDRKYFGNIKTGHYASGIAVLLSAVVILTNIQYSNGAYTLQKLLYDRTIYHTGRVIEDMQEYTEYDLDRAKIRICGVFRFDSKLDEAENKYSIIGGLTYDTGINLPSTFAGMTNLMGVPLNHWSTIPAELKEDPEVKEMPCYPNPGYIKLVDGKLIVKLSN